ncbi:hypothetical protein sync_1708 [Synechococcus sp. CC9311]|nr:hypothetical protein sync_1708 [Synechococcus sp. CC9311]
MAFKRREISSMAGAPRDCNIPVLALGDWYKIQAFGLIIRTLGSPQCGSRTNRKPQCQLRSAVEIKE